MTESARTLRRNAVNEMKRSLILDAARQVFESEGLEGASVRAIAKQAGYTAGAIYSYFEGKEHIYAAVLTESLERLRTATAAAASAAATPQERFAAAGLAFYDYYAEHPRDLDLGFYLYRGGMRPHGLSASLDRDLNSRLLAALDPIKAAAVELGAKPRRAVTVTADVFGHAAGLLLLAHTRRLALFKTNARDMMTAHLNRLLAELTIA